MRGQQALEYTIIVGATIALVLVVTLFYFNFSQARSARGTSEQVHLAGQQMVATAKETFLLGTGARETLTVRIPNGVERIYVAPATPNELVITYTTRLGTSDAVFFSEVNMLPYYPDGNITNIHLGTVDIQFSTATTGVNVEVIGEN